MKRRYTLSDLKRSSSKKIELSREEYDKLRLGNKVLDTIQSILIGYFVYRLFNNK